ncbi:MAG: hypothetical protein OXQ30_01980 [Boseongicola sp.]|nr:hypothetical protein [Boseongicola sp.]
MKRDEFFNSDGTINMDKAMRAGRQARSDAAMTGARATLRFFRGSGGRKEATRTIAL